MAEAGVKNFDVVGFYGILAPAGRLDRWLLVVLAGGAVVALGAAGVSVGADARAWPVALLLILVAVALPVWVLSSTRYTVRDRMLDIASGPFRWQISINTITALTPTRNPLSSPALSLDRLRIEYGGGKAIMVSPMDKESFMRAVNARRASTSD